ncbi:MAG TPA: type III pantothenate kinase [Gallionella sp.]|nr:type III pantothenate kinase [Gallionella sp.]
MRLLIDAGNTRIKWALTQGDAWLRSGVLPVERVGELFAQFADAPDIQDVWVSNVAGEAVAQAICNSVAPDKLHFIVACERQCGVRNGYAEASRLGSDRWAALIGAWHLVGGCCLVVNCGTATTVDALSENGEFIGGLILPGVELMQRSLCGAAAQLQAASGAYAAFPCNTADAMYSGVVQASCGAIERQHGLLGVARAEVVLSGGAAEVLRERLNLPLRLVDNLVLQGLWLIAQETKG